MEAIIQPVDRGLLKEELSRAMLLTEASRGSLEVYCLDASFPGLLREIGRLRETAFRMGGGGTGKACDLDRFDTDPAARFRQLVVWDAEENVIAGGYRFIYGYDVVAGHDGQPLIPSAHIFHFSDTFLKEQMPHTMELSRSFVSEEYLRTSSARKSVFVLDCLFKGVCIMAREGGMTDFFGKVTFYPDYPGEAFSLLTAFMEKHCSRDGGDIVPIAAYPVAPAEDIDALLRFDDFRADFRALTAAFIRKKLYLPPILKSYMNLTTTLRYYGSSINDKFGNVVEMGLKLHIPDMDRERWEVYFQANQ